MTTDGNSLLNWLKQFTTVWLPQVIPNDRQLVQSITTKLLEAEQLLIGR
jgi:hypothetical protein